MSDTSSHSNEHYLDTPERKKKMSRLKKRIVSAEKHVSRLITMVNEFTNQQGESVDPGLHSDLVSIMSDSTDIVQKTYAEGTFTQVFWDQQLKAASAKDSRQVRRHPLMIKFCLNLKLISSSAYHALRTSGFVRLPSVHTNK